jgi:sodium transport system permease protein
MVLDGSASLFREFPGAAPEANQPEQITAVFDEQETKSQIVLSMVQKAVAMVSARRLVELLTAAHIDPALAAPIQVKPEQIKREDAGMGGFLAGFLPYLIVIWAFYGGFGLASDLVAGEKERQTLETLLISPLTRREIALAKFLSLLSISTVASLSSLIAVLAMGLAGGPAAALMYPNGVNLSIGTVFALVLVVIPLAAMFAGLLLAISAFARNSRECQTYLSLISFVVLMPAVFSQFLGFTDFAKARWVSFVPVLNSAAVLRESLLGKLDPVSLLITVLVSSILALATILWAVRMFEREEVLVRI